MTGVEILNTEIFYEMEVSMWLIPLLAGCGLIAGLIVAIIEWFNYGFDIDCIFLITTCILIGLFFGVLGTAYTASETDVVDHIEYKVTIDDSVSMNEFLDKYEILDQEGKIYTVKEKE